VPNTVTVETVTDAEEFKIIFSDPNLISIRIERTDDGKFLVLLTYRTQVKS
jgi:hypothetical protein